MVETGLYGAWSKASREERKNAMIALGRVGDTIKSNSITDFNRVVEEEEAVRKKAARDFFEEVNKLREGRGENILPIDKARILSRYFPFTEINNPEYDKRVSIEILNKTFNDMYIKARKISDKQ